MKKVFSIILALMIFTVIQAQNQDTLRRSAGFYLAPAHTGISNNNDSINPKPSFGLNLGYRFVCKLKYGFFLEGGAGISWLGAQYPDRQVTINAWGRDWTYSKEVKANQLYVCAPFLAGYRTTKGKVRFQAAAGISLNIKYSDFRRVKVTGEDPYGIPGTSTSGEEITFGTSFSGIVKAGISIPLKNRLYIDILPALRYNFLSTMPGHLDFSQAVTSDFQNWSAGIDLSLMWALDNNPPQTLDEFSRKKEAETDYTYQYNPDEHEKPAKEEKVKKGPYNFIYFEAPGSGLTYSFNYERTLIRKDIFSLQARGGYGVVGNAYSFPLGFNVTFGHATQKFEAGLCSTFESVLFEEFNVNIVPELAYRLETKNNFFLRLAVVSHYVTKTGEILPGFGVSVGGCF
ncbi:MAG TPA: outer membrane beta-barrel protein [Bacteroidales bacterium]|nr:outer membrane beta-barrel protein [Bacteroidales bacterium]